MSKRTLGAMLLALSLFLFAAGCKKKVVTPPPPPPPPPVVKPEAPPPPPAKPAISRFTAEPSTIERGQSSTLRWAATGASDVSINQGIGPVQNEGSRQVFPTGTTTYTLTARGPGGTSTMSGTVNVTVPPPPPPPPPPKPPRRTLGEIIGELETAHFDYDKSDVREDARAVLTRNADRLRNTLREYTTGVVTVEGHCDERGSAEYNLGLGDRRSTAAREFLVQLGVSGDRLRTVSYGKERPVCTESDEGCWQRNRRAFFTAQ